MNINLITLSTVKTQLGIPSATTTYDAALTALIPIVSADVRRVLNNQFDGIIGATFSAGSNQITFGSDDIAMGTVINHANIPADTYITAYDYNTGYYTMSANATGSGDYINPTINISMFPAISKMIEYRRTKQTATSAGERGVTSKTVGPVSISYSDKEINKRWAYPQILIDDLGIPIARIG